MWYIFGVKYFDSGIIFGVWWNEVGKLNLLYFLRLILVRIKGKILFFFKEVVISFFCVYLFKMDLIEFKICELF